MSARMQDKYEQEVRPALLQELGIANLLAAPKVTKVVINVGLGEALANGDVVDKVANYVGLLAGQKPTQRKAKKSIAGFKLREGNIIGVSVTLRGKRMYEFLDKLFAIVLPRVRDFRGLPTTSFDANGNYSIGLTEQTVFPEIDYTVIDRVRGLQITIVNTAKNKDEAKRLLELLGLPFRKDQSS